jgi:mannose-6-phosphate isomerase-like protein (cupin superfamily)
VPAPAVFEPRPDDRANCGYNPRVEVGMRTTIIGLTLALASSSVLAQQPSAPGPAQAMKLFASSADVAALAAKANRERKEGQANVIQPILQLAPYAASLESRNAVANAAVHEKEAEMFYVIDGSATLVTGGKLVDEKRTNADNLSGSAIANGMSRHVAKGDFIMVPEGTPHWFSAIDGSITLMSLHLPHSGTPTR